MQAESKGEISACGGSVERGEFVHNTHNETPHWLEQCCDTDIAVQYCGVTIINGEYSLHTSSCKSDQNLTKLEFPNVIELFLISNC